MKSRISLALIPCFMASPKILISSSPEWPTKWAPMIASLPSSTMIFDQASGSAKVRVETLAPQFLSPRGKAKHKGERERERRVMGCLPGT